MPRVRRRAHRQRADFTYWHAFQLCSGSDLFGLAWGKEPDPGLIAEAWEDLGTELLALHTQYFPGTRPWAWWLVAAPEKRRHRIDGKAHPFEDRSTPLWRQKLFYGVPATMKTEDDFAAVYETQAAYLHRFRLITAPDLRAVDQVNDSRSFHDTPHLTLEQVRAWMTQA